MMNIPPEERLSYLENKLAELACADYPAYSRVHALKTFPANFFVKRDDELGFGISGSKFRKYRFLIPYLRREGYTKVIIIGGAYSNNILSITQLLIENGIEPVLFLRGEKPQNVVGNFLLLNTLIPLHSIHWIAKNKWHLVENIAYEYAKTHKKAFVLPEGARNFLAFLGALTLALDIIRNESSLGISFDHIYIDVGTGLTAAALLLGLQFLSKKTNVHLIHLADTEDAFMRQLQSHHAEFEKWLNTLIPLPKGISHTPAIARSFGSTNKTIFSFIKSIAQREGFFIDPIYSAKLFYTVDSIIRNGVKNEGNSLIINSGGALSLMGFQQALLSI